MIRAEPWPEPPPPGLLADITAALARVEASSDEPNGLTNDVDLAFAAASAAVTLPRGFLRGSDAQRVLADYQRIMRAIFGYATDVNRRPGEKSSPIG